MLIYYILTEHYRCLANRFLQYYPRNRTLSEQPPNGTHLEVGTLLATRHAVGGHGTGSIGIASLHGLHNTPGGDVTSETFVTLLVNSCTVAQLLKTVTHKELVPSGGKERRRDVDQDGDPAVVVVRKGFAAVEDCSYNTSSEISGKVGADGDVGETPAKDVRVWTTQSTDGLLTRS